MTWEIGIAAGGVMIATIGFLFPVIRRAGRLEQKVKDVSVVVDKHTEYIEKLNDETKHIKVILARVDANTANIKESVEKLEERK
jgi:GTP:adenosylcobinamide-phosphate guanylyltransferase